MPFSTPNTSWVAGDPVLYIDMNRIEENTEALHNPPANGSGFLDLSDYSASVASFANIDGTNLSTSITITGDTVLVIFSGVFGSSVSRQVHLDISVDGVRVGGDDGLVNFRTNTSDNRHGILVVPITGLSAGSHTFNVMWKNDGTTLLYGGNGTSGTQWHPYLRVMEVG